MTAPVDDLSSAIPLVRGLQLDWLGDGAPVDSIALALAGLANAAGGALLIGISGPSGLITGVQDADAARDRVLQAALTLDPPLILPIPQVIPLHEKRVLRAAVPAGLPHVFGLDGRFVQRRGSETTPLSGRDLRQLVMQRGDTPFESFPLPDAALDDLDWDAVRHYLRKLDVSEALHEVTLVRRGCLVRHEGKLRPTRAGVLLFAKEPQRFFPTATITAVRFNDTTMSDNFTRHDISGQLPEQIRRVETILHSVLRKSTTLGETMTRSEDFEYPLSAARELIVNAVAHRDYSIHGDDIRVLLFDDRMEIVSPGRLPGPMTLDNITSERFSRNPVIVQVLSDLHYIERLGYGLDRVIALMDAHGMKPPRFDETTAGFRVTLYNRRPLPGAPPIASTDAPDTFRGVSINPRQVAALHFLQHKSQRITNSDLQALCPDVHPETIRRDLADLVSKNILRKLGEKRGSYYMLTPDPS